CRTAEVSQARCPWPSSPSGSSAIRQAGKRMAKRPFVSHRRASAQIGFCGGCLAANSNLSVPAPSFISETSYAQPVPRHLCRCHPRFRGARTGAIAAGEWPALAQRRAERRRPLEYYFGATGGGLWKTTDGGTTWRPVTDGQITSSSVGAIAVAESNPD